MTNVPSLEIGPANFGGASIAFYYLVIAAMLIAYLGLRLLVNSHYGHVVTGIRDDVERTRMLGYNVARCLDPLWVSRKPRLERRE